MKALRLICRVTKMNSSGKKKRSPQIDLVSNKYGNACSDIACVEREVGGGGEGGRGVSPVPRACQNSLVAPATRTLAVTDHLGRISVQPSVFPSLLWLSYCYINKYLFLIVIIIVKRY